MEVHIKGLNICAPRRQNLLHYKCFLERVGHTLVDDPLHAKVVLVWTCGFRDDVIGNSVNELNRSQREYPGEVIALGCLPDINRQLLQSRFDGRIVSWKTEGPFFEEYFGASPGTYDDSWPIFHENCICKDASEHRRLHPDADVIFADQFFKLIVSQGCPYNCSYCTEKLAFPAFQSQPEERLLEACRRAVQEQGQQRIMLIADCLGQYGIDIDSSLPQLIKRLKKTYPQTQYALQNFHPKNFLDFYDDMKRFIEDGWLVHINLPVQSGSDAILKAMRRQYSRSDLDLVFGLMRDLAFNDVDTHIIVGFPGESDADFEATLDLLRRYRPRYALVSKYYDAPTAPSFNLGSKVDAVLMSARLKRIEAELKDAGIIHNIDGASFMQDRLARINRKTRSI